MKKKLSILTVAFVVMTITTAGQRAFADSYALLDKNANGLSSIINSVFSTGYTNNLAFSNAVGGPASINLTNEFHMDQGSIFVLSSRGGIVNSIIVDSIPRTPVLSVNLANPSFYGTGTFPLLLDTGVGWYNSRDLHDNFIVFEVTGLFKTFLANSDAYRDFTYDGKAYFVGFDVTNMQTPVNDGSLPYDWATFLVLDSFWMEPPRDPNLPEPATVFLWTLGGLSLAGASWRRNRNKKKLLA